MGAEGGLSPRTPWKLEGGRRERKRKKDEEEKRKLEKGEGR